MDYPIETKTISLLGIDCLIEFFQDRDSTPWDDCGHGAVRKSHHPHTESCSDKKPGERPLNQAGRNEYQFYYNWQAACKTAKLDGWDAAPYGAPDPVLRAVQSDFDFLRGFVNDSWQYVGIVCTILDSDGEKTEVSDSLWGVETFDDYHISTANDMSVEIINKYLRCKRETWRAALREARERKYWACRDVETTGA